MVEGISLVAHTGNVQTQNPVLPILQRKEMLPVLGTQSFCTSLRSNAENAPHLLQPSMPHNAHNASAHFRTRQQSLYEYHKAYHV